MHRSTRSILYPFFALVLAHTMPALGADADTDALDLQSTTSPPIPSAQPSQETRLFVEGAVGNASQRYLPYSRNIGRASLDFWHTALLGSGLRAVVSDRLDQIHPRDAGASETVNSLREAYLSWQPGGGNTVVELGRINLRYGPGYGYNPTDFFRDGSLRVITTADPFALRENRLGTVMLRAQRLWTDGSVSATFTPKLADRPSSAAWSLDLGSTNNRDRALLALGTQFTQRLSSQLLVYKQQGLSPTVGGSLTALLSDAAVAHLEGTHGREPELLSRVSASPSNPTTRNRLVAGVSYTTLGKLSVTAEYQYNGFGLSESGWAALAASPATRLAYLREALRLQELALRRAYLLYVTQKSLGLKDLDLTAYLRLNPDDDSRLAWVELRHHWPSFDLSLQFQRNIGRSGSEFGVLPDRRIIQVIGRYFF